MAITPHPSPNQSDRRGGVLPDMAVIHYTGMVSAAAALARLCDPAAQVSAHYLITEDGTVLALVPEERRAWHAGAGGWGAVSDVNSRSVGIELANTGAAPFPEPQMTALERLLDAVMRRWAIPPARIIGHADIAPERKDDPGPRFDWRRLARHDLAVWSDAGADGARPDVAAFADALTRIGYPPANAARRLRAFRARFRPWGAGPLAGADMARAADLARRFPVDANADAPYLR